MGPSVLRNRLFLLAILALASATVRAQQPAQPAAQSPEIAQAAKNIALVDEMLQKGQYAAGKPLAAQAVAILERALGKDALQVAQPLSQLGECERMLGDLDGADVSQRRAVALYETHKAIDNAWGAIALYRLADLERMRAHTAQALQLQQRVEAVYEKVYGAENTAIATCLNSQAELNRILGNYAAADALHIRAIALFTKLLGDKHPYTGSALQAQATTFQARGLFAKAEVGFRQTLEIFLASFGENHLWTAVGLNNLGELERRMVHLKDAETHLRRALASYEATVGPDHLFVAATLNNLGGLMLEIGHFDQAAAFLARGLQVQTAAVGSEHPDIASMLTMQAQLLMQRGDLVAGQVILEKALAMRERVQGVQSIDVANVLEIIGQLHIDRGDFIEAEKKLRRAWELRKRVMGDSHRDSLRTEILLANFLMHTGDVDGAQSLFVDVWQKVANTDYTEHPQFGQLCFDIGNFFCRTGEIERGAEMFTRTLAIYEQSYGPQHAHVATALAALGVAEAALGRRERALALTQRALAIDTAVYGANHAAVARDCNNFATFLAATDQWKKAEVQLRRALAIDTAALGPNAPTVAKMLAELAVVLEAQDKWKEALKLRKQAMASEDRLLSELMWLGDEARKSAVLGEQWSETWATISHQISSKDRDPQAVRLALNAVLARKGRLADVLTESWRSLRDGMTPKNRNSINELAEIRGRLAALALKGPGDADPQKYREELQQLETTALARESALGQTLTAKRPQWQPIELEQLQAALPDDAVLIEIVEFQPFRPRRVGREDAWSPPRYIAYALRKAGEPNWLDLGPAVAIDAAALALRTSLSSAKATDWEVQGRALEALVAAPLRKLAGNAKHILLSPDGALQLVPLHAMADADGNPLLAQYRVTYLASGRDLLHAKTPAQKFGPPLLMADPDFEEDGTPPSQMIAQNDRGTRGSDLRKLKFKPLPGTAQEAVALTGLLPNVRVLTGAAATETALKSSKSPQILHIATHGFFLPVPPVDPKRGSEGQTTLANPLLRSGLAFAGFNARKSGGDDGALTALEAAGLDLRGTQLVVLSACSTGVGESTVGAGVYGLRRAFAIAGAQTLVMSLWNVDDDATRALMTVFYRALAAGTPRGEALRQAQLQLRTQPAFVRPYYWAAFFLSGQWQ